MEPLFAEADALRRTDPGRAVARYLEHAAALDPVDAGRVGWLAKHARIPEFEPLFRAALRQPAVRVAAALALGSLAFGAWRLEEAEKCFRIVVREGEPADPEWPAACVNLAQVYRSQGLLFESLVVARHAGRAAHAHGRPRVYAVSRLHILGVASDLEDADRMERALAEFGDALAHVPEPDPVLPHLHVGWRARLRALRGDYRGALADMDRFDAAMAATPGGRDYVLEGKVFRAEQLVELGRVREARALLDEAGADGVDRVDYRLYHRRIRLMAALAADEPAAAHTLAHDLLEDLWTSWLPAGTGTVLRHAALLGRLLLDEFGEADDARHAFDLAARAMLARIVELDRCVRELPAIAEADPEDEAVLSEYRRRFAADQRELLETAARYLGNRAVHAADLIVEGEAIAVCAWCQRVRVEKERWLPIAEFVPEGAFELNHCLCGECAKATASQAVS